MKDKVKKYIDNLFTDVYDTKQLRELKEEINANLLEKVNDFIAKGESEDNAFNKAISSLGDMNELIESLKKASAKRYNEDILKTEAMNKKQVLGYVVATVIMLIGVMMAGIVYLQQRELSITIVTLMPFILVSVPIYIYLGLTQETGDEYGMNKRRALVYSFITDLLLFGLILALILYLKESELYIVFSALMPFIVISTAVFIYLGLTERSRLKMGPEWKNQWVQYYTNPQSSIVRGSISGALWIFSIAIFFILGFTWSWKYSWIIFIVATGFEVLIEAYFASKRKS